MAIGKMNFRIQSLVFTLRDLLADRSEFKEEARVKYMETGNKQHA
jgi:hypothetical protein